MKASSRIFVRKAEFLSQKPSRTEFIVLILRVKASRALGKMTQGVLADLFEGLAFNRISLLNQNKRKIKDSLGQEAGLKYLEMAKITQVGFFSLGFLF